MIARKLLLAAAAAALPALSMAHHGWLSWDHDNPIVIEGWVSKEMDGYPHWEIDVRVDGEDWEVDVGDDIQLRKAGLRPDGSDFRLNREIRVEGLRLKDENVLRILPRRVVLDGDKAYPLVVRE